ncbi:MAG: hypothetical protein ACTSWN_06015 [Promethearchaeota archaeon]
MIKSNVEIKLLKLFTCFKIILQNKENILRCFEKYQYQSEGWFKAELISYLDLLVNGRIIESFEREVKLKDEANARKVDIKINFSPDEKVWIELKHWYNGEQGERRDKWYPEKYFKDKTIGPFNDVEKLNEINGKYRFLVIFNTPNISEMEWNAGIKAFNEKFCQHLIKSISYPEDFPKSFFIGIIKIDKAER